MTNKTTPSKEACALNLLADQTLIDQFNHELDVATKLRNSLEEKEAYIPKIINELSSRGIDIDDKLMD